MREKRKPKVVKFSSVDWLVNFLNLRFNSTKPTDRQKVEQFLSESWPQDDTRTAHKVQQQMTDLMKLAINGNTPEGLVMALNDYVADNSESWDPSRPRPYPPVRAHWYARRLNDISALNAGQAVLKMGNSKWVVQPAPLMHGTEGRVWLSISQCLTNGELSRIRRCLRCRLFFITDDARRKFCKAKHQREYDAEASKARVSASRERQRAKTLGIEPPKRKAKEPPLNPITDAQRFAYFLKLAQGNVIPGTDLALFIKQKIPGDWRTVNKWLAKTEAPGDVWENLPVKTKTDFKEFWGIAQKAQTEP